MDIQKEIEQLVDTKPKSTKEKNKLAVSLINLFETSRTNSELNKWLEAMALYYIDEYDLYQYVSGKILSKKAFFAELDIPPSSAYSRITMYRFYIKVCGYKIKDMLEYDIFKLSRAVAYIQGKPKKTIEEVVEMSKRKLLGRQDFIENLKEL